MELKVNNEKKKITAFKGTALALLSKLKIRREECLVKINGKLVPDDCELGPKDKVEIIQVVFGG
jgi:thiamine biosynthesis protein ThiS